MRNTYEQSKSKLELLKKYIINLDTLNSIILQYLHSKPTADTKFDIDFREKKIYDYSLTIIRLYGIFENFLEGIVCAYLNALSSQLSSYSDLPEEIRENNLNLSAKLLNTTSAKFDSIKPEEIIKKLYSCFDDTSESYSLNVQAFRQHTSNFREDSMTEFLHHAGIKNFDQSILKNEKLRAFLGNDSKSEQFPRSKYFEYLKDLVERRNIVAHGETEDDILSTDILKQYIEYISLFIDSIYESVLSNYYNLMIKNNKVENLGNAIETFGNNILGINSGKHTIKVGQKIIARNNEGVLYWGDIKSIHIKNTSIEEISSEEAIDVGIMTSFKVKKQYSYFVFSDKYT